MPDEQPRSKSIKVSGVRKSGVIVKRIKQIDGFINFLPPTLGTPHPTEDGLYYFDADFQPTSGGWGDLMINYSWKKDGVWDTELRTSLKQSPLRTNKNYRLKWDYVLISETETVEPTWWNTAKAFDDIKSEADYSKFEFVKNISQAGTKKTVKDRIKSVDYWMKPAKQILERWYFEKQEFAQNRVLGIGKNEEPADDFGVKLDATGGTPTLGNWLLTSAPVSREGGYWVVRKTFELSDEFYDNNAGNPAIGWDDDFYGATQ